MCLQAVHFGQGFRFGTEVGLVAVGKRVLLLDDFVFLTGDGLFLGEEFICQADRLLQGFGTFRLRGVHVIRFVAQFADTGFQPAALDQEIAENAAPERRVRAVSFEKPRFLQKERGLTAAERGTAMHAVMQYLDFARPADEQSVREQVMQLRERRQLTPEQAAAIDVHEIAQFLRSPLAQRIRQAETLYREYRFALLVPATLYDPKVDEREQMMLQGVVDCCFDTPEGLVIVDFKTDRVRLGQEPERAEVYRPQLEAYSRALSRVLERNISERILYFFATGQEISL